MHGLLNVKCKRELNTVVNILKNNIWRYVCVSWASYPGSFTTGKIPGSLLVADAKWWEWQNICHCQESNPGNPAYSIATIVTELH